MFARKFGCDAAFWCALNHAKTHEIWFVVIFNRCCLTESISELLIKYQTVAKWDGKLPTVMAGSDNMLIDIPLTAEQPVG